VLQAGSNKGAAQGDFSANNALIEGTTLANNPDVLAAQAKVDAAKLIWNAPLSARRSMASSPAVRCRSASASRRATR
jgi:hypothetical protein